jgi:hypothetical protein
MEVRANYAPSYEKADYLSFLAGRPYGTAWMDEWLTMVRQAAVQGRRFCRVRVVNRPLNDYNRWSYVLSRHNIEAGEDIRYLDRELTETVDLPEHDYWLFDSRTLGLMRFGAGDRFEGVEIIDDPGVIVRHCYWRDAAWHHALRRDDFAIDEHPKHV